MSDIEQQSEQLQAWPFAPSYESSYSGLPPSQLREAVKRLSDRKRNPLSVEKLTQEDPEIEGVLSGVKRAYLAKKERAKVASATKRASQRQAEAKSDNVVAEVEVAEDVTASVTELSLEPAEVVAVEPEPVPEPVIAQALPEPNLPGGSPRRGSGSQRDPSSGESAGACVGVPPLRQAQVKPPASKPIQIPLARQQTQQTPQPRNQTKKSGLAAMFA